MSEVGFCAMCFRRDQFLMASLRPGEACQSRAPIPCSECGLTPDQRAAKTLAGVDLIPADRRSDSEAVTPTINQEGKR